jgi:integrase/recombinase XerD
MGEKLIYHQTYIPHVSDVDVKIVAEVADFDEYVADELHRFSEHLMSEKRSGHTVKQYVSMVRHMFNYLGKRAEEITPADLERFKRYLALERDYSKNSLYTAVKAVQAYFRYRGLSTAEHLKPPRRPKQMPKYLTRREASALLEACRENPRDHAIVVLLIYSGLRVGELCNLTLEDIDFSDRIIRVRSGKGDKDRIVPISHEAVDALKAYLKVRPEPKDGGDYLFVSRKRTRITTQQVERIIRNYAKKAGIRKKVTPHVLRHTLATTLLRNGADIRYIQQILGHSSVATTQIYTHVDEEALRRVYDAAAPHF